MKPIVIFFIIFILIIGIGIGLLYYFYEKPAETQLQNSYVNFNIYAKNNDKNIVTGYKVDINGVAYDEGKTSKDGATLQRIPANYSQIEIYNYNLENQNFYTTIVNKDSMSIEPQRIILKLEEPGKLNITQNGKLDGNLISLNISSVGGNYRKPQICLKYSIHLITVQTSALFIDNSDNYSNFDKCYELGNNIYENSSQVLELNYKYFDSLDNRDYLNITIFDNDCINNKCFGSKNKYEYYIQYGI